MVLGGVNFSITFHEAGNYYTYSAITASEQARETALAFAEFFGMAIEENGEKGRFSAWCTGDTYTYIIPYKINEFKRAHGIR